MKRPAFDVGVGLYLLKATAAVAGITCVILVVLGLGARPHSGQPTTWAGHGKATHGAVANRVLMDLWRAERAYRDTHGTYAPLDRLRARVFDGNEIREGAVHARSECRFTSTASRDHYSIVATPTCSECNAWTLAETKEIRP